MQTITIPQSPPRDPSAFRKSIDFSKGLRGYFFSASVFSGTGFAAFISVFLPPYEGGLIAFKVIAAAAFGCIGFFMFWSASVRKRNRIRAFTSGSVAEGKVTSRSKIFVPWKSARDHLIKVEATGGGKTFTTFMQTSDASLAAELAEGSGLTVIIDESNRSVFIPQECGVRLA